MEHPFPFTLDLLRQVIAKAPVFFSVHRKQEMESVLQQYMKNPQASLADIERSIIHFGREIWPYRKAFWSIHDTVGRDREKRYLREGLSDALREKYSQFLKRGGRFDDIRRGSKNFESSFTPTEKQEIIAARLNAHERLVSEIHDLCAGAKQNECTVFLGKYRDEQKKIDALIARLRALAERTEQWKSEILNRAEVFEAGWSGLEPEVTDVQVEAAIEYYTSMMKSERILSVRKTS